EVREYLIGLTVLDELADDSIDTSLDVVLFDLALNPCSETFVLGARTGSLIALNHGKLIREPRADACFTESALSAHEHQLKGVDHLALESIALAFVIACLRAGDLNGGRGLAAKSLVIRIKIDG